ncbi:hypothetical protein BU15DRAFT_82754 [Melanogaster broomeanus]|nr:hypothetical protein BU15DRAFT_82754 [Melanogaster broomeanus]
MHLRRSHVTRVNTHRLKNKCGHLKINLFESNCALQIAKVPTSQNKSQVDTPLEILPPKRYHKGEQLALKDCSRFDSMWLPDGPNHLQTGHRTQKGTHTSNGRSVLPAAPLARRFRPSNARDDHSRSNNGRPQPERLLTPWTRHWHTKSGPPTPSTGSLALPKAVIALGQVTATAIRASYASTDLATPESPASAVGQATGAANQATNASNESLALQKAAPLP